MVRFKRKFDLAFLLLGIGLYEHCLRSPPILTGALQANNNASLVKEKEKALRAKSAEESKKQRERDQELRVKQLADKEKEKRRTQKKEKRRM